MTEIGRKGVILFGKCMNVGFLFVRIVAFTLSAGTRFIQDPIPLGINQYAFFFLINSDPNQNTLNITIRKDFFWTRQNSDVQIFGTYALDALSNVQTVIYH